MIPLALPGDEIEIKKRENREIVIGPGLRKDNQDSIVAVKSGILKKKENTFYWIESHQKRVNLQTYTNYFVPSFKR